MLRRHLVELDFSTRHTRNGHSAEDVAAKNYKDVMNFTELLLHFNTQKEPIVIGLINWRSKLPSMTLAELQERNYKWDNATNGTGKKIERN